MKEYKNQLKLVIQGELPDGNTYIDACRRNKFVGAKMKEKSTENVMYQSMNQTKKSFEEIRTGAHFTFHWYCLNMKIDPDNISFAKKFIFDGLQLASVIKQDTWKIVKGFSDEFFVDKENPRVEVFINY